MRPQAPGPPYLCQIHTTHTTHLAPKRAAAVSRGKLLLEQVKPCLKPAPAAFPTDIRTRAIASTAQRPQTPPRQVPGAPFAHDNRNVLRPSHPPPRLDVSMGDESQNERSSCLETPSSNSLGNPLIDDVNSPLGSTRIERGSRSGIEASNERERYFASGNPSGGRQQAAAHQGAGEGTKLLDFGNSANMVPISGGEYTHAQNGLGREPPRAQGAPYLQNAPEREAPRAPTTEYKSPYTMNSYTKNSTNPQTHNSAIRDPQGAGVNLYTQGMPTREPPRNPGEFSRVNNALLLDAGRAGGSGWNGKFMPEKRKPKNFSSIPVPTNPNFPRRTSTPKSASPFAVVIHSASPAKTSHHTKYHNSPTYSYPEPVSTDEAPAKSRIGDHRASSFRVEINSSPKPSLHSPSTMFPSGQKRGRPFATPEAAAKAAAKAARQGLSENGDNTGKKRGRPFAAAEAAEKAAKKLKSSLIDSEEPNQEPKKRGRRFATENKIVAPDPCFPVFYCEWKGCPAELHNLETLRKHLHILHGKRDKVTGMIPCMFRKCANSHTEKVAGEGTGASSDIAKEELSHDQSLGVAFKKRADWHVHLEEEHLIPIAWHLGDGPKFLPHDGPPGEYDIRKSEPWLFDANGNQVTPSVRNQKLEAGRASFNNGRRYKLQLQRELAQAKRESLLAAGDKVMKSSSIEKKGTGLAVVLNSKKISAEDYKMVDVDDEEDEMALDTNHPGYEDVFDEDDEGEGVGGNR